MFKQTPAVVLGTVLLAGTLVGCASSPSKQEQPIGMANPASVYCEKLGGKSVIEKNSDGSEYGVCHLPDGSKVEEWELYRRDHPAQ